MNITLPEVARKIGLRKEKGVYYCPEHDQETPDLHIESDRFCCFTHKGPQGGTKAVSLVLHLKDWDSVARGMEWLAEHFPGEVGDLDGEELQRRDKAREALSNTTERAHAELMDTELEEEIRDNRELELEDLEEARLGLLTEEVVSEVEDSFDNQTLKDAGLKTEEGYWPLKERILIPYLEDGRPVYLAGREVENGSGHKYKKLINTDYNRNTLYSFFGESDQLILTEGPFDALSARKAGFDVVSPVTNQFSEHQEKEVSRIADSYDEVILAFDQDDGGEEGTRDTAEMLLKNGVNPRIADFPSDQDLDDYTTYNGYNLDTLVEEAERYLDQLIKQAKSKDRENQEELIDKVLGLVQDRKPAYIDRVLKDLPGKKPALREQLEQIRAEAVDEEIEDKVSLQKEQNLYSSLELQDVNLELSPSTTVNVKEHLHTVIQLREDEAGTIKSDPVFKVYSFTFGEGENEEEFYLFTDAEKSLSLGEKKFPLRRIDLHSSKYSDPLRETFDRLKKKGKTEGRFEEFLSNFQPAFARADELRDSSIQELKELSNERIREIVVRYLDNGYWIAPSAKQGIYPKYVNHDKKEVRPQDVASSAAHSLIYTPTKTGKSYTADRAGELRDKVRVAGLTGFADADGENKGILDGMTQNFFIDEISSRDHEERVNDKLLTLMEKGTAKISQAGRDLTTRFYASITYLGNPVSDEDDVNISTNEKFIRITEQLGENTEAMGSRIGLVLVDMDIDQTEGESLPMEEAQKLETLAGWIQAEISTEYSLIEKELRGWIEQKYPTEYEEKVDELRSKLYSQKLSEFWDSHKESYRHARGQALRMAVFQRLGDVLCQDYTVEKIQELAEEKLQEVMEINLNTLRNMVVMSDQESVAMYRNILREEDPRYLRYFVYSVISRSRGIDLEELHPVSSLRDEWLELKEELDEVDPDSKYSKWAPIETKIRNNRQRIQSKLSRRYGIWMEEEQEEVLFKVSKPAKFRKYQSIQLQESEDKGNASDTGNRLPKSPKFSNGRWVRCEECGSVQLATSKYDKCTNCDELLPEKSNIRGYPVQPQSKGTGNTTGGTQHGNNT